VRRFERVAADAWRVTLTEGLDFSDAVVQAERFDDERGATVTPVSKQPRSAAAPVGDYQRLGIVFDIEALANMSYGRAAYLILFRAILPADRRLLAGAIIWDGDTAATLAGGTRRDYVIAVGKRHARDLGQLHHLLSSGGHRALRAGSERFLTEDALAREPLVPAASFDESGDLQWSETPWIRNAWEETLRAQGPARRGTRGA
jgi:hypothetical protein